MLACDFFHADCALTLKRIYVFFVLEVGSRHSTRHAIGPEVDAASRRKPVMNAFASRRLSASGATARCRCRR